MRSAARAEESGSQVARVVERQLRWFWRFVTMPVLFGLVGATVNFAVVDRAIISRACAIIIAGTRALCRSSTDNVEGFLQAATGASASTLCLSLMQVRRASGPQALACTAYKV